MTKLTTREKILDVLGSAQGVPMTGPEIAAIVDISPSTIRKNLKKMREAVEVTTTKKGPHLAYVSLRTGSLTVVGGEPTTTGPGTINLGKGGASAVRDFLKTESVDLTLAVSALPQSALAPVITVEASKTAVVKVVKQRTGPSPFEVGFSSESLIYGALREMEVPIGIHEIGARTRIKRGKLQQLLDTMVHRHEATLTRGRARNLYQLVS